MHVTLTLSARRVIRFLIITSCCLFILSLGASLASVILNTESKTLQSIFDKFNLDLEANLPTWYSSALLLGVAGFLFIIAYYKRRLSDRFARHWFVLGLIFILMSIDETASIHELIIPVNEILNLTGFLRFAWVIPGALFVIIFAVSYFRFVQHLPPKTRNLMIAAGVIYVSGALLSESIGGYLFANYGARSVVYIIETQIEELLEIFGLITMIYTLMTYIEAFLPESQITSSQK